MTAPGSRAAPYILLLLAAAAFAAGMLHLFRGEFASGDAYPEYSSLRAGPEGAKLLFDGLTRLPGLRVERSYIPVGFFSASGATIFELGVSPGDFDDADDLLSPLEKLARLGNRIVVGFHYAPVSELKVAALRDTWGVRCEFDPGKSPAHRFYFAEAKGWKVLENAGTKLLAVDRAFGTGSVALFAESETFDNVSMAAARRIGLVSDAVGSNSRVVFDEDHFGIEESGSVAGLARRYRLTGLALGLALFAALFFWKNVAGFPPPAPPAAASLAGRTSQAGLITLLRRHIRPAELAETCWRTWLETNRRAAPADRAAQIESVLREPQVTPLEAVRRIRSVLGGACFSLPPSSPIDPKQPPAQSKGELLN
jgi:hypothetical protein